MSFKNGPHISQVSAFWVEGFALGILTCDIPSIDVFCLEWAPSSSTPCQQPESREVSGKLSVPLGGKGNFIRTMWLRYTGMGPRDVDRPRAQNKSEEPTVQDRT